MALQVCGLNCERQMIGTVLGRMPPQIVAAWLNRNRRCAPIVTPGLPPPGALGVASLKPSPAPSLLRIVMVAALETPAANSASAATSTPARSEVILAREVM